MPKPPFNWDDVIMQEKVSRLVAGPFFEEAGSLLTSAAFLWPGRHCAKELLGYAQRVVDAGKYWRQCGTGWASANLPGVQADAGPLLNDFRDIRTYRVEWTGDGPAMRNERGARLLARSAMYLMTAALPIIANSGDHLYRGQETVSWSETLELIGYTPCAKLPAWHVDRWSVPPKATWSLVFRALSRTTEGYASSLGSMRCFEGGIDTLGPKKTPRRDAADLWYTHAEIWRKRGRHYYADFVETVTADVTTRQALALAMEDSMAYTHSRDHYSEKALIVAAEKLAEEIVAALWSLVNLQVNIKHPVPPQIADLTRPLLTR
ncbi:MAG: hypothetical protein PHT12_00780 [Patescibacteria group bacterium]|nr:hypothetical protein [Patescibacteria group bacterium]